MLFYRDFATCVGTICLVVVGLGLVTGGMVILEGFAACGVPIVAAIYAWIRWGGRANLPRGAQTEREAFLMQRITHLEAQLTYRRAHEEDDYHHGDDNEIVY